MPVNSYDNSKRPDNLREKNTPSQKMEYQKIFVPPNFFKDFRPPPKKNWKFFVQKENFSKNFRIPPWILMKIEDPWILNLRDIIHRANQNSKAD